MSALSCRYADFAGSTINDGFDYTHGRDLWKEKLDYTNSWLSAHISDADAIGKPLIVEEFGKAVSAKKVYTGELPHSLQPGAHHSFSSPHGQMRQPVVACLSSSTHASLPSPYCLDLYMMAGCLRLPSLPCPATLHCTLLSGWRGS